MLVPNSHGGVGLADHPSGGGSPDKLHRSSPHPEKGGHYPGKPVSRTPSSSASSSSSSTSSTFTFPPPLSVDGLKGGVSTLSSHTVIQTTHHASEPLSLGLPSANFYSSGGQTTPIIGYIAGGGGGGGGGQQPISYHASLPQHLLIPGAQPVILPVSGGGTGLASLEAAICAATTAQPFPAALPPHTYIATTTPTSMTPATNNNNNNHHHHSHPKGEPHIFEAPAPYAPHPAKGGSAVIQAQLHLPVVQTTPPPPLSSAAAPSSLPPYFIKGSIIQLADGELKRVEDLKTEDFIQSAEISSELKIDSSTVERIDGSHTPNFAIVQFSVGEHRAQVSVEVLAEYPFFVFGQGWSSCCPDRTSQLLELPCTKLSVGDVCISLTLKNLRNGSLKKAQSLEVTTTTTSSSSSANHGLIHGPLKHPKAVAGVARGGGMGGARHTEQQNGLGQRGGAGNGGGGGPTGSENGELRFGEKAQLPQPSDPSEPSAKPPAGVGRKRRWSAPEGRKVEKPEEEPPLTLPKPSFLTQEVKISMEGRSNIGK